MPRKHLLLICLTTALVYGGVLGHRFIIDDFPGIVSNPFIKSPQNIPLVFSKSYLTPLTIKNHRLFVVPGAGSGESTYRPVVTLSYFLDYKLWKLNPAGYHLTSLLLHVMNAILLYFLAALITRQAAAALLVSLLFAVHPVNAEAVNVISFREDLFVFLFAMGAFLCYAAHLKGHEARRGLWVGGSVALFLLALFSKEMAVTFPAVLAVYYVYFVRNKVPGTALRTSLVLPFVGYFFAIAFYLWVWGVGIGSTDGPARYSGGTFATNLISMTKGFGLYIRWFLWPVDVRTVLPGDPLFVAYSWRDAGFVVSLLLLFLIGMLAVRCRRVFPAVSFGIVWIFITLLPVANIWPLANPIASRYLYLPSAGFCLLAGSLAAGAPRFKEALAVILVVFFAMFTFIQNGIYKNQGTYLLSQREKYPASSRINFDLGNYFFNAGLIDQAIEAYQAAIASNGGDFLTYKNLGHSYYRKGMWAQAGDAYARALALEPTDEQVINVLGYVYMNTGRFDAALSTWERLSRRYPEDEGLREHMAQARNLRDLFGEGEGAHVSPNNE